MSAKINNTVIWIKVKWILKYTSIISKHTSKLHPHETWKNIFHSNAQSLNDQKDRKKI